MNWGADANDVPVPADYDGDGVTAPAFYRPSTGLFYIIRSTTGVAACVQMPGTTSTQIPILRRPQ